MHADIALNDWYKSETIRIGRVTSERHYHAIADRVAFESHAFDVVVSEMHDDDECPFKDADVLPFTSVSLYEPPMERHDDPNEQPHCAQGYCCGCSEHPIAKPWGWNHMAWERHYEQAHPH